MIPRSVATIILLVALLFTPTARAEFGFHAGSHFGFGRMGPEGDQSMGVLDFQFMPGYRVTSEFLAGIMVDYRFMSQLDSTSLTTDYSGNGLLLGVGAAYQTNSLKVLVSYDFRDRHSNSNIDQVFKGSGWHFLLGYELFPQISFDIEYVIALYDTLEERGVEVALLPKVRHSNMGFGVSYSY